MKLLLATTNAHKAEEVRAMLADTPYTLETLADYPELPEPPETGDTFEHNAFEKAQFVFDRLGIPVLADDSGLAVDALDGAPGVHSKRFSPEATHEANNTLLLQKLEGVTDRSAAFVCLLALVTPTFRGFVEGRCPGAIATHLRGAEGFGYDPLFLPDAHPGKTMAELSMAEKNAISHRGRAFAKLSELLGRAGL